MTLLLNADRFMSMNYSQPNSGEGTHTLLKRVLLIVATLLVVAGLAFVLVMALAPQALPAGDVRALLTPQPTVAPIETWWMQISSRAVFDPRRRRRSAMQHRCISMPTIIRPAARKELNCLSAGRNLQAANTTFIASAPARRRCASPSAITTTWVKC